MWKRETKKERVGFWGECLRVGCGRLLLYMMMARQRFSLSFNFLFSFLGYKCWWGYARLSLFHTSESERDQVFSRWRITNCVRKKCSGCRKENMYNASLKKFWLLNFVSLRFIDGEIHFSVQNIFSRFIPAIAWHSMHTKFLLLPVWSVT